MLPPVPTLQRQADRKVNFVENLVDSAAQIVETIWQPPKYVTVQTGPKDGVLPLRTFIQETLRRSRTSYSTLQVALYYLIVIRPHLPPMDYQCSELDAEEAQLIRAKQCGRRMFLAALILASKYLQDRNYSARAWSKISGLNTQEINVNEMAFLKAVDWKLHMSEMVFQRWTDLVLKYTSAPSPSPVSPTRSSPWSDEEMRKRAWCELILCLSPDLHEAELGGSDIAQPKPLASQIEFGPPIVSITPSPPPPPPTLRKTHSMPAPALHVPRSLEPQQQRSNAFTALHQHQSTRSLLVTSVSNVLPPAASVNTGKRLNSAMGTSTPKANSMAGVARSAMSSALSSCVQEAYPSNETGWRRAAISNADDLSPRKSNLATCVTWCDEPESAATLVSARAPAFKRQDSLGMHRLAVKYSAAAISSPKIIAYTPMGSPARPAPMNSPLQHHRLAMASPKSTEAARTLNLLRDAPSPATSVGSLTPTLSSNGRKRSCPSAADSSYHSSSSSSGVTPKFRGLAGFTSPPMRCAGSPVIGSPSMGERCGKRARSSWELDGLGGVAQGVR